MKVINLMICIYYICTSITTLFVTQCIYFIFIHTYTAWYMYMHILHGHTLYTYIFMYINCMDIHIQLRECDAYKRYAI